MELELLENRLGRVLMELKGVAVAFSGGADSTLLLFAAQSILGGKNVLALTVNSVLFPAAELKATRALAACFGVEHRVLTVADPAGTPWENNPPDRCYHCKRSFYTLLRQAARERGLPAVIDGSNADDTADCRPGMRAARELEVRSPLQEAGLGKAAVRALSRRYGLVTWNKPAAPCLATRIPYGELLTAVKLKRVERAEEFLRRSGFTRALRVRSDGAMARIEVSPEDFPRLLRHRLKILSDLYELGFTRVTVDLAGFRGGSRELTDGNI